MLTDEELQLAGMDRPIATPKVMAELLRVYRLWKDAPPCVWTYDDTDADAWDSTCGGKWCFTEGNPEDNGVNFCHKCEQRVRLVTEPPTKEEQQ